MAKDALPPPSLWSSRHQYRSLVHHNGGLLSHSPTSRSAFELPEFWAPDLLAPPRNLET